MPPKRAFDYELLRRIWVENPHRTVGEFWAALRKVILEQDPNARVPALITVKSVLERQEPFWEAETGITRTRSQAHYTTLPPVGTVAEGGRMAKELRYLREIERERAGDVPTNPKGEEIRLTALNWERKMRSELTIADLDSDGVPITRKARAEEINSKGELIALAAWLVPGWRPPAERV